MSVARAAGVAETVVAGEPLILLAEGAALVPAERALLVADLHLGKAEHFGAAGLPVPSAANTDTLARLDALIQRVGPTRLIVLGDLMHGPLPDDHPLFERLRRWVHGCPVPVAVVAGNHDRQHLSYAALLGVGLLADATRCGPFALRHEPGPAPGAHVLAGHLHPVTRVHGRADSVRLRCFWIRDAVTVLPAFGAFTGGMPVRAGPGDRLYVTDGQALHEIPPPAAGLFGRSRRRRERLY